MTYKEWLKDVMAEINLLKEHATSEEKDNLNFKHLDSYNIKSCIYGQMTGLI